MTSLDRTTPLPSMPTRTLVLVGYFACVAALIAALVGTWAVYRRHVALAHWPTVASRVDDCRLQRYPGLLESSRPSFAVRCRLAYGIGTVRYASPVRSPFTVTGADSLGAWIAAHPRGSTLLVHYDPREPASPTLAGTGLMSEDEAVSGPFRGALAFGGAGAILLLGAAAMDRRREKLRRASRRWPSSKLHTPPVSMGAIS